MGPRWKGKGAKAKALADPVSNVVSQLQSSLIQSEVLGLLSGCSVLLAVELQQTELLTRACFGHPITTSSSSSEKHKQWFELGFEEAFYLCYFLRCLKIVGEDNCIKDDVELWQSMKSKQPSFPNLYKAYSHLRQKNWVVRPGSQYGVDYVAYRHHPSLVHSEYAVLVLPEGNGENGRLRVWSDVHCTVRLCGSVAKTLLVLSINRNDDGATSSPSRLAAYTVKEHVITRWSPLQSREDQTIIQNRTINGDYINST